MEAKEMLKNKQGITLVELLIVIVIMGIIAAIAIPAVGNIVENTRKDALLTDAQTIANQTRTACLTEEWLACDVDWNDYNEIDGVTDGWVPGDYAVNGEPDLDEFYLENDRLGDYVDGIDGNYMVWYFNGTRIVAFETDDYVLFGDPAEAGRGDVVDKEDNHAALDTLDPTDFIDNETDLETDWPTTGA